MITESTFLKKAHFLTFGLLIPFIRLLLGIICLLLGAAHSVNAENSGKRVILFLGDSLTAGYGVDPEYAYPSLIQTRLRQQKENFKTVNAGISGDTTAGGLRRLDWLLKQRVEILILALGANDGLRGLPLDETERNLRKIIAQSRKRYPNITIVLAGMLIPPNMGEKYANDFKALFPRIAEEEKTALIPFLLEGVAAVPKLNLADGIHPNEQGYALVADTVWSVLKPLLDEGA